MRDFFQDYFCSSVPDRLGHVPEPFIEDTFFWEPLYRFLQCVVIEEASFFWSGGYDFLFYVYVSDSYSSSSSVDLPFYLEGTLSSFNGYSSSFSFQFIFRESSFRLLFNDDSPSELLLTDDAEMRTTYQQLHGFFDCPLLDLTESQKRWLLRHV